MSDNPELSEREREILVLVATGASNKEIAQQLYISANTVKVHLRNIFAKIGAASRTEAAMYAVNSGMLQNEQAEDAIQLPVNGNQPAAATERVEENSSQETGETASVLTGLASDSNLVEGGTPDPLEMPAPDRGVTWIDMSRQALARSKWVAPGLGVLLVVLVGVLILITRQLSGEAAISNATAQPLTTRWLALADMPTARYGFGLAEVENQIYTIGGESATGPSPVVERYDPKTNTWTALMKKPTPVSDVKAASIGGKIYVPGGNLSNGQVTGALEVYDPQQDSWETGASLPHPVSAYALVAFEGRLYLFGGWDGQSYLESVYEYDPVTDIWKERPSMPTGRGLSGACALGGRIYVQGGRDENGPVAANEVFSPAAEGNSWMKAAPLPAGRYAMGMACVGDAIHLIGGEGRDNALSSTLQYFPSDDSWKVYEGSLEQPVSYLGVIPVEAYLYTLGGQSEGSPVSRNQAYQIIFTVAIPLVR